jgi:F0F1-type ATP synthase assembly protein I
MKDPTQLNKYAELMGLGIEIAVSMALPLLIGIYIDHRFESTPWGVLGGALLGMVSMSLKLYKVAVSSDTRKRKPPKPDNI